MLGFDKEIRVLIALICRIVAITIVSGAAWEMFTWRMQTASYDCNFIRFIVSGIIFLLLWQVIIRIIKPKTELWKLTTALLFPYLAMIATVVGLWTILLAISHYWIFLPHGFALYAIEWKVFNFANNREVVNVTNRSTPN